MGPLALALAGQIMGEVTRHDHVRNAAWCEKSEKQKHEELRRSAQPRKEVRHCAAR